MPKQNSNTTQLGTGAIELHFVANGYEHIFFPQEIIEHLKDIAKERPITNLSNEFGDAKVLLLELPEGKISMSQYRYIYKILDAFESCFMHCIEKIEKD